MVAYVLHLPIRLVWWRSHAKMMTANLALLAVGVPAAGLWLAYPWMLVCLAIALLAVHGAMSDRVKLETQTLESLFELADILDARDKYTHGHSERVGHYAEQLAVQLELPGDRTHLAFLAGRLHDIGKCAIDNEVLLKPGELGDSERDQMRRHPEVGSAMLAHFSLFREVAQFVRGHHERWDGDGYPDGLRAEAIPLESRIIAIVDSYDAMTTTRPYRVALPHAEAVRRLRAGAGEQWDPKIVSVFVEWVEQHQAPTVAAPLTPLVTTAA
jgi:putative nucleotidyltransferase with HDIG domain